MRYLLLCEVALGRVKDYGREEPNIKRQLLREPEGYHSVGGTEQNLTLETKRAVRAFEGRRECRERAEGGRVGSELF